MRIGWIHMAVAGVFAIAGQIGVQTISGQATGAATTPTAQAGPHVCECGANPPAPPKDRVVAPYANEPADMSPYSKFAQPYDTNYTHPNLYSGAARDVPEPKDLTEIRIGFFVPLENSSEAVFGQRQLHGAQLAIEEANARGGYGGKPFKLMLHNDYNNWQSKAVYGEVRPTEPSIWGSASDETVKMVYDEKVWAIFGSINSESTHIALRVALRAEIPIVNSASTDATIPETYIPWFFETLQDDREQDQTLARRIYTELGLKRVATLRSSSRYGRFGITKFMDASRRLGHPVVMEQIFQPGDTDYTREIRVIKNSRPDALVIWGDEKAAAAILKQMRAAGMKQPAFGQFRTLGSTLLSEAGDAAEGFEAVYPYDPTRKDPAWVDFNQRYEARFHEKPEQFASLAYDTMNILLDSICKAGLNRARIHDALASILDYEGVTGHMHFDPNQKNVAPLYLGTVHNGAITYVPELLEKKPAATATEAPKATLAPYAKVGEEGVSYNGPQSGVLPMAKPRIVVFGPHASEVAKSNELSNSEMFQLLAVDSDQNWGKASTQLVQALMDEHPLAILALDRNAAHLSMQLALKCFVPVVAISSDKSLTSTNVPWIFREGEGATAGSALHFLRSAFDQGATTPDSLRVMLASGKTIDGQAFLTTGEPILH